MGGVGVGINILGLGKEVHSLPLHPIFFFPHPWLSRHLRMNRDVQMLVNAKILVTEKLFD